MAKTNDLRDEADAQYYFGEIKFWYEARRSNVVSVIVEAKSDEELENSLSLAYRLDDFIKTSLFESLKAWEEDNPKFRVQKA